MFIEMLDRLTTMFSHPTMCSAMLDGICSGQKQAGMSSYIPIAFKCSMKFWMV